MFKFLDMPNWPLVCALWIYKDLNLTPTSHQHLRGMKIHSSDNSTNFSFAIYLVIWKGRKLKEKMKGGRRKWKSYWGELWFLRHCSSSLSAQTARNRNLKTWTQTVTMTVRNMKVDDSSLFVSPWAPQVHRAADILTTSPSHYQQGIFSLYSEST